MRIETVRVLRDDPGIATTLAVSEDAHDRFVVRRLDLSMERPWSAQWLEGELEATRRARLPHVVPTRIVHKGADYVELVRPFVAGLDIREWHAQEPGMSCDAELELMCKLFYALASLHRMGIAHGGVRPSNVMLTEGTNELVLLDATVTRSQLGGLTHPVDLTESRYLLPEGHGLAHPTAGFAADIYAAGWVVLEALAETNRTASAVRRVNPQDDAFTQPARLVDIVGVPAPMRPIFLKLLDPRAGRRFEAAEDVLAAAEAVVATGGSEPRPSSVGAPSGHHGSLAYMEPPLVGRSDELAALTASIDDATRSAGSVICVSGESGVGKSRLLDAAVAHAEEARVTLIRAGAFDHAPARPLGLFAGPLYEVVSYIATNPVAAQRVRDHMAELLPAAFEQVPGLAEAMGASSPVAHGPLQSYSTNAAPAGPSSIARLLLSVFDGDRPGVIVLDDCQWADDLSWQVLARLAAAISKDRARSEANVSLICSCRTEAVAQVSAWGVPGTTFLGLKSLSEEDTEVLIRSISDGIPDEVIPHVTRYSGGNPLETLLAVQALKDSSALTRQSDRWVLDENAMAPLALHSRPREIHTALGNDGARTDALLSPRLSLLSPGAASAIRQGAVLGRRFSSRLVSLCLSTSQTDVEQNLAEATQLGIVRRVADGDQSDHEFEFAHDRLREAVLGILADASRRELHLRAAHALDGDLEVRPDYDIAYQFDRAGRAELAVPSALRAGEAGLSRNALDVAERNFRIAEKGLARCESADNSARFRLYEGLGTVHMLTGSYDSAARELVLAHQLTGTQSGLAGARIAALLGELAFKTGRFDDATESMRQGMQSLDLRMPRSSAQAGLLAVAEIGLLASGWLARRLRPGRAVDTERFRLAAQIHDRLVYQLWFIKSPIWVVLVILRGARFAWAAGGTRERAHVYCAAAVISGIAPILAPLALRLADFSLRLSRTAGDDWGTAHAHHFRGFALYAANRYEAAITAFDTANEGFDVLGDRWEQVAAMWQKSLCLARLGRLHEAGVLARDTYWEGKRRGDRIGAGTALAVWVQCLPGDVNVETIAREVRSTNPGDHHTLAMLHAARAWRLFHTKQYTPALDAFRQADEIIQASGLRNHFLVPILTSHLQVLRLSLEDGPDSWTEQHRDQARNARRLLRRARRLALVYSGERPAVLREWALRAFSQRRRWRGRIVLGAACRSAHRHEAHGELAACALVAALVGYEPKKGPLRSMPPLAAQCRTLEIRVDGAIVRAAHSRDTFEGGGAARHRALIDAVNSIVASDGDDEVLDKLRDATFATTTARQVELADGPESGDWVGASASLPTPVHGSRVIGDGLEMRVTDRIVERVPVDGRDEKSIIAAFPLGEGQHHQPTVEVLAALAGAVIEREGLRRRAVEQMVAVQEAERGRIARDLHDEFGHLFATVIDRLSALQNSESPAVRRTAADVRQIVRNGIQVARSVAWSLRPSGLDDLGLIGCVEQYVEDCRRIYPIRIELVTPTRQPAVSAAVATSIFRIVQEALTNIGRHSGATEASVTIVNSGDALRVVVEDDGRGFDLEIAGQGRSLGLIGMRERARLVGGRLSVESTLGQGVTIMVEVPVKQ